MIPPGSHELHGRGHEGQLPRNQPAPRSPGRGDLPRDIFRLELPDPGDPFRAEAGRLHREANSLYQQGKYELAEPVIRELLRLQAEVLGRRHPDYATGLSMLAELRFLLNDRGEAEGLLRQILEIRKDVLGDRHPDYAVTLGSLAAVVRQRGDLDQAEALLQEALKIRKEVLGTFHPDAIQTLGELGRLRWQKRRAGGSGTTARPRTARPMGCEVSGSAGASAPGPLHAIPSHTPESEPSPEQPTTRRGRRLVQPSQTSCAQGLQGTMRTEMCAWYPATVNHRTMAGTPATRVVGRRARACSTLGVS